MANSITDSQNKKTTVVKKRKKHYIIATILSVIFLTGVYFAAVMTGGIDITDDPDEDQPNSIIGANNDISVGQSAGLVRKEGFYNFLLIGTDKAGANTDTILLISFDTKNKKINILQIPRDTRLNTKREVRKINAAYAYDGIEGLEKDVENLLGVPVDRYAIVSISAFKKVVNAIDGVEVTVPEPGFDYDDPDQDLHIHLKPGTQVLKGDDAEGFVRFRHGYADADLGRIKAQRAFMASFIKKILSPSMIVKAPQLIKIAFDSLKTDMKFDDFLYLGTKATSLNSQSIEFFSAPGETVGADFGFYKEETMEMINKNFNPYTTDIPEDHFDIITFTRQLSGEPDISGTTSDDAVDTKLSHVIKTSKPNDTQKPEEGQDADQTGPDANTPSSGNETPDDQQGSPDQLPGGSAEEPETPSGNSTANNTIKIELINSTDDNSVLEKYQKALQNAGFQIINSYNNSSLNYQSTAIVIRKEGNFADQVKKYLPTSYIIENYQGEPKCDITVILGDNAK